MDHHVAVLAYEDAAPQLLDNRAPAAKVTAGQREPFRGGVDMVEAQGRHTTVVSAPLAAAALVLDHAAFERFSLGASSIVAA